MRTGATYEDDVFAAISDGLVEVLERVDATRAAADGLKRYERQALQSIAAAKRADPAAPTPEQVRIINGFMEERPIYAPNSANKSPIGTGFKVCTTLDRMLEKRQISQAMHDAGAQFRKDYLIGHRITGLTAKYGERMGAGGTPVSQQIDDPNRLCPEERRAFHLNRFLDACGYVGHEPTIDALVGVVCEETLTLAEIGHGYEGYGSEKQQSASGRTLLKTGLDRLVKKYGTEKS